MAADALVHRYLNYTDRVLATYVDKTVAYDKRLSFRARGLFVYMASFNNGKDYTISELSKGSLCNGYQATKTALMELEKYGYVKSSHSQKRRDVRTYYVPNKYMANE